MKRSIILLALALMGTTSLMQARVAVPPWHVTINNNTDIPVDVVIYETGTTRDTFSYGPREQREEVFHGSGMGCMASAKAISKDTHVQDSDNVDNNGNRCSDRYIEVRRDNGKLSLNWN